MRRLLPIVTAVICLIPVAAAVTTSTAAATPSTVGSTGASTHDNSWRQQRHQFDYQREPIQVTEHGAKHEHGAVVHDITYRAPGQDPVSAYLVTPSQTGRHPAALFLHWLDTAEDSNRGEFLAEAEALAAGPDHTVSLLPQLTFPFAYFPVGDARDKDSIVKQVVQLRRGLDLLDARHDVIRSRVAVVGHDYGAMYATLLSAVDRQRIHATVIMAADSTMSNWFLKYFLDLPAAQIPSYARMLRSVDPIRYLAHEPSRLLLQYATNDIYIPISVAEAMHRAARPGVIYRTYAVDHSLNTPQARTDRDAFLTATLTTS